MTKNSQRGRRGEAARQNPIERFKDDLALAILQRAQQRRRRRGLHVTETERALEYVRGLLPQGLDPVAYDQHVARIITAGARLEAAGVSEELSYLFARIGSASSISTEDLRRMENHGIVVGWEHP